jgi:fibronectin-binding autotransporter adhesin
LGLAWSVGANAADLQWSANGVTPGGGGTGTWNTSAPALWFNGATFQTWNNAALDNAVFGGTAGTVTLGVAITAHNLTFNTSGYTVTGNTLTLGGVSPTIGVVSAGSAAIGSVIAGTAGLTNAGLGTLTLSGANNYTGGTTINAGTLSINSDARLGNTSGGITFGGGTLQSTASFTSNRGVTVGAGGGTFNTSSGTLTLGGVITGTGPLTKIGAGTLTLTGNSTYAGGTTINAGTFVVSTDANLGADSGGLTFGGGTLQSTATFTSNRNVTLTGGGTFNTNAATTLTLGGAITGTGSLSKSGTGTLTLTGANTYTGTTTISAGTLALSGSGSIASSSQVNVSNAAGTFDISGTSLGATITTLAGVTNSHVTLGGQTLTISNGSTTYAGIIQGTGGLTVSGGTQILSGANTYTGATNVNAGTLQAGATNTFAPTSAFTVASGATLVLSNFNQIIGSLAGAGTVTNGSTKDPHHRRRQHVDGVLRRDPEWRGISDQPDQGGHRHIHADGRQHLYRHHHNQRRDAGA